MLVIHGEFKREVYRKHCNLKETSTRTRQVYTHVHDDVVTTFDEAKEAIEYQKNDVPVVMRRIRRKDEATSDSKFNEKGQLIEGSYSDLFYDGIVTQLFKMDPTTGEIKIIIQKKK